jgi:hypothetical protein
LVPVLLSPIPNTFGLGGIAAALSLMSVIGCIAAETIALEYLAA